jgi:hypothetical protein
VGKPDNPEDYLAIEVGEWARRYGTVYVPWEIWKTLRPVSQEFVFYIPDYGRFRLDFDVPIRRLKGLP